MTSYRAGCRHEESLYGRCTACGATWDEQASGHDRPLDLAAFDVALTEHFADLSGVLADIAALAGRVDARSIDKPTADAELAALQRRGNALDAQFDAVVDALLGGRK